MDRMYNKPRTLFQEDVNSIMKDEPTKDLITDIIHLLMFKQANKDEKLLPLVEIYNLLGVDKFTDLIDLLDGRTVTFPKREEFKETVQVALCYYESHLQGKKWSEIKDLLNDPELQTIKMSAKTQSLQRFMEYFADRIIARKNKEAKEKKSKKGSNNG
jgi:hypothetical protein